MLVFPSLTVITGGLTRLILVFPYQTVLTYVFALFILAFPDSTWLTGGLTRLILGLPSATSLTYLPGFIIILPCGAIDTTSLCSIGFLACSAVCTRRFAGLILVSAGSTFLTSIFALFILVFPYQTVLTFVFALFILAFPDSTWLTAEFAQLILEFPGCTIPTYLPGDTIKLPCVAIGTPGSRGVVFIACRAVCTRSCTGL